jgi:hypothetical protein
MMRLAPMFVCVAYVRWRVETAWVQRMTTPDALEP